MENKNNRKIHYLAAVVIIIVSVVLDQVTKRLAIIHLKDQEPLVLIKNVFQLDYLENRGAAFGLFQNQRVFFLLSVVVICIIAVWFYVRVPLEKKFLPLRLCAVFIVAGALGNCIDRVTLNYVVDFLYFKLIDFPVFNVADIFVTVSTFALALLIFFYYKEEDFERILHR